MPMIPLWSPLLRDSVYAGMPGFDKYAKGQENGTHWVPTESNVSIRPGWYYHPEQDNKVKSLSHLVDIYFNSVGRNSSFLLNLPVDTRDLVHENDEAQLMELAEYLNTFMIQEYIPLGQRILSFSFELKTKEGWQEVETGATVGNKRLIHFETLPITALRFSITDSKASPVISNLGVYKAPELIEE